MKTRICEKIYGRLYDGSLERDLLTSFKTGFYRMEPLSEFGLNVYSCSTTILIVVDL
jgi:hypothetical protein